MMTQRRRVLAGAGTVVTIAAVIGSGFVTTGTAVAVDSEVPREPIAKRGITLSTQTAAGTTIAWTGNSGTGVDLREYDSQAQAEAAGLTTFRAATDGNGFVKFITERTGECLTVTSDGVRAGVSVSAFSCRSATSNFSVEDGRIVSPYGWSLQNERITLRNQPKAAFAIGAGTGADLGVALEYEDAVAPADFDVTVPEAGADDDRAWVSGRTQPNSSVFIHDGRGAQLTQQPVFTDAEGAWRTPIAGPQKGSFQQDILVSVHNASGLVERSRGTVTYGQGVSASATPAAVGADGTALVRGHGDAGAQVQVLEGGTGDPVTVSDDGTWELRVTPPKARTTSTVVVGMTGVGGAQTAVPVEVEAVDFDPDVVFPADPAEPAYAEGEAPAGAEVVVLDEDGTEVGSGRVPANGHFEVDIDAADTDGEVERTVALRQGDTELARQDTDVDYGAPVRITSPADGADVTPSTVVRGTGEPGAEVTLELGDRTLSTEVRDDGTWSGRFEDAGQRPFALTSATDVTFTDRSKPAITGTGTPGATVRFQPHGIDPRDAVDTTVRADGTWRIAGSDLTVNQFDGDRGARYDALVVQQPGAGEQQASVHLEGLTEPLRVTSPEQGSTVVADRGFVTFTGFGTPGDEIVTRGSADGPVSSTVVRADGTWTIRDVVFAAGEHTARLIGHGGAVDVTFTVGSETGSQLTVVEPTDGSTVTPSDDVTDPGVRFRGTGAPGSYGGVWDVRSGQVYGFTVDDFGGWSRNVPLRAGDSRVRVFDNVNAPVELTVTTVYP
ncbi:Ig-like domain-containing protein [Curtobacterium luteum]|uniref:Ig-like domain-containing protein n=1 Tax=Curtobacterium luteum TaxID=33881 RepID=UPI00381E66FB